MTASGQDGGEAVWRRLDESGATAVAIVGLSKNAGKTSVLTAILERAPAGARLGLLSAGIDGEERDSVTGLAKPRIVVPRGALVATAARALEQNGVDVEWMEPLGIHSTLGEVWIARIRGPAEVLLAGVRQGAHIRSAVRALRSHGAERVFVDGAFDRAVSLLPGIADGAILAVGASYGEFEAICAAASLAVKKLTLPRWRGPAGEERVVEVEGLVTDEVLGSVVKGPPCALVTRSPAHLFVSGAAWRRFERSGNRLWVRERPELLGIAVNPVSPDGRTVSAVALRAAMERISDAPVWNVRSGMGRHGATRF